MSVSVVAKDTEGGTAAVPWPQAIVDDRAARILRIRWEDGSESVLPHRWLRARCRCAACSQIVRTGGALEADKAVALTDILPVADRGLNLVFSDGHGRGIYPWTYLRELGEAAVRGPWEGVNRRSPS